MGPFFWLGETVAWLYAHSFKYRCSVMAKVLMEHETVEKDWILKHMSDVFVESNLMQAKHIFSFATIFILCFLGKVLVFEQS